MDPKRFKQYRRDGFPLCPKCGEDELVSSVCMLWDIEKWPPPMPDILQGGFHCMNCEFIED